ncbi:MAG TPA: ThuA domain-containing protein [Verrucomicrobiae bacterium]|nr:ThuA domain-containing protein [Verrucomicrobiae bacterium]
MKKFLLPFLGLALAPLAHAAPAEQAPQIVLISAEYEYSSSNSLPAFKRLLETNYQFHCTYLQWSATNDIPGIEALDGADLAILFMRRTTLPEDQLAHFKKVVASGKPVIGLRTASHAFENWKEWDHEVLGGNYHMHHGNQLIATARINPENAAHPILKNVARQFETGGSLYKTSPLSDHTTLLLIGSVEGQEPEPMAWTHEAKGARVFYTSLGHTNDFANPSFRNLLVNAVFWSLGKAPPERTAQKVTADELEKLWRGKQAIILDVRRPSEFAGGHIPGAVNLSVEDKSFEANALKLDPNKTYVVHCAHGVRSAKAAEKLEALNFPSLLDFSEGFSAWQKAAKPVEK